MPFTNTAAGIRPLPRLALRAVSFGVPAISRTTPIDRMGAIGRAGRRRMTSVRGPPAAWHSGMSYIAAGAYGVGVTEIPAAVAAELARLRAELARLRAENARLLKMLELSPRQAAPPGPAQAGFFDAPPGPVHQDSPNDAKVAFFRALFAARTDIYATRIENSRTGWKGWLPAVRRGWQRGIPHEKRDYLPLTADVLAAHLKGAAHIGVYPLLDGDRCWWLAADFDGQDALTEALMYVKAGRAFGVPVALEVSRSGVGMHAWVFFTAPVPAHTARRLGTGLLREAMAVRGKVNLASYDRLFPSQDLLPGRRRREPDRAAALPAGPGPQRDDVPEPGESRTAPGSVVLPVNAWPHDS